MSLPFFVETQPALNPASKCMTVEKMQVKYLPFVGDGGGGGVDGKNGDM